MYIDNVTFHGHKIFGSCKIKINDDSTLIQEDKKRIIPRMEIDLKKNKDNIFTFIIGDNGVGKSTFFKTIINYMYANTQTKIKSSINPTTYLWPMGIYNVFTHEHPYNYDIIKDNNIKVIHISNENTIISESPNVSFKEFHPIFDNIYTLFLPLLKEKSKELKILETLLSKGNTNNQWTLHCEIATRAHGEIGNSIYTVLLAGNNSINFFKLIELMNYSSKNKITKKLPVQYMSIYSKLIDNYPQYDKENPYEILSIINKSFIYTSLVDFILKNKIGNFSHMNIRLKKETIDDWNNYTFDFSKLTNYDIITLSVLTKMGLIEMDIKFNNIPLNCMSLGEQLLIKIFSYLAPFAIENATNIILFYDEPENSLHPKWQQQFPLIFYKIVNDIYRIKESHFIFCTHSPLIIQNATKITKIKSSILKFQRFGLDRHFESKLINNINKFCIEELFMTEFDLNYRNEKKKKEICDYLDELNKTDPIDSVKDSELLKDEIDNLYSQILNNK